MIPYTYLIGWTELNRYYYGVRYAKGCHPGDFFVKYFTSSGPVHQLVNEHGTPDVIQIRQTFTSAKKAVIFEGKVLRRLRVTQNEKWLNQSYINEQKIFKSLSPEHRQKIGDARRGKKRPPFNDEWCRKISEKAKTRKRKPMSEETKAKMRAAWTVDRRITTSKRTTKLNNERRAGRGINAS